MKNLIKEEYPLLLSLITTLLFVAFGSAWLADLSSTTFLLGIFTWLFVVILLSAFAIVRHAESLAILLGEPLGTLILTLSVIGVEVLMISAVMLAGKDNPTIARDTMFSVVMILLGGMTGVSLLVGGWLHHEQTYNLQGANAYLAMIIPLAALGLVLPNYTTTTSGPTLSTFQSIFSIIMSCGIYAIFLAVQTSRHREYFISPEENTEKNTDKESDLHGEHTTKSVTHHSIFLIAYILPLVLLAKQIAVPLDYGLRTLGAPSALGGFIVAILILSPEAMSAVRAAIRNQLQRSVNILLGSVLATISLTTPAVLSIGLIMNKTIHLGLDNVNSILLLLLLSVSVLTFSNNRTNVLLGAVHCLLFFAYMMLMFEN